MMEVLNHVLLIDAYNSLFQLYHVKERDVFWRFTTDVKQIMSDLQISKVIVCCDAGESKYRLSKHPGYKAVRKAAREREAKENPTEAARRQRFMEDAREFLNECEMFGFEVVKCPGIEADDIIAYIVQKANLFSTRLAILSSDTDLFQLLRPNVVQRAYLDKMKFKPLKIDVPPKVWVNTSRFIDVYNITPQQWPLVKSLAGDKADSVDSPEGLGDVLAMQLVQKYGTLDAIIKAAESDSLDIPRLRKTTKVALASPEGQALIRRNVELINLLYTPQQEAELFDPKSRAVLDDVISRLLEPPVLDVTNIKERMFEDGRVKLYHDHAAWVKPFRGFIHSMAPF